MNIRIQGIFTQSITSVYKYKHNFYFKCYLITFKIYKLSFKISFVDACFGFTRPSSGNYQHLKKSCLHLQTEVSEWNINATGC
jgi:hypothetical protein